MKRYGFALLVLLSRPTFSLAEGFVLEEATIADIHRAMRDSELSCRALVSGYLARIDAYDQKGPALNAVLRVNPRALQIADELDGKLSRSGFVGPLHCVPVLLKDNIDTADMPTTAASVYLAESVPETDAFLVRRLREAGALILAKVHLSEFASSGVTRSSLGGQTLNPYDPTRTPGGSSGGTGAALAANFGTVGIGTDTVNSIRSPSSANSLVGIRPTRGLVSRSGVIVGSETQDMAGPMARTVTDAVRVLDVIGGYDPSDPATAWSAFEVGRYGAYLDPRGLEGARLGVLESFFGEGGERDEVSHVVRDVIGKARRAGATVVTIEEVLDPGELLSGYMVMLHELERDLNRYLSGLGADAPVKSVREMVDGGQLDETIAGSFRRALELSAESEDYFERRHKRETLRTRVMELFARHRIDALVYPHQRRLVVPIGERQAERNGVLAAVAGFPAITLPAGFSAATETAPIGVPIGIELMGPPWHEGPLIRIAYALERVIRARRPPRSTPPLSP